MDALHLFMKTCTCMFTVNQYNEAMLQVASTGKLNEKNNIAKLNNGFAGYFYIMIYQQGRARDMIDFDAIRKTNWAELGTVNRFGRPGITLFATEDDVIEAIAQTGRCVGNFYTCGRSHDEMVMNAEKVRSIALRNYHHIF